MKRADLEKRAQRDKFGSGKHGFQGGNPATGQLPTIPGAEWFDHVQEEIAGVIEGAGLTVNSQNYNQLLQAIRGLMAAGAVPYTGATRHADLNGKNLTNVGEVKLGDGRNNGYQQLIMGNYERSAGNGNYGAVFNGKFAGGPLRWATIATFGEDGNHISSLFADATKAYVRIGSANHELATKGTTLAHYGIADFQVRQMPGNPDTIRTDGHYAYHTTTANLPATGAYHLHVVAGGAASWCRQIAYKAYSSEMWMRWQVRTSDDNWSSWVRIDGADWADVRGRPTTLAGYGITDAASKAEVAALVTGNLADQGWTKLPNGLILQWGKTPSVFDWGESEIHFPIAFPSAVLNIQLTEKEMQTVNAHASHLAALNVTNQGFTFKMNSTLSIHTSAYWLAIGK